ncbi:maestro heat-like repeat-containing protein family member 2B [Dromaius novaehollandiae]|uniref:maestro heat-like repeat-containing protein family member 2B n=1 Tax=Dromaius novaehollandiae TaxID=8790 RepID=UPI00311F0DC3
MEDHTWMVHLNAELTQQMAKYPNLSKEKGFLYKAVGTALAASQNVSYVQEQMQSYLEGIRSLEPSEREGPISVLACCAESHLDLALTVVRAFDAAAQKSRLSGVLTVWEENEEAKRAKMCAALMLAYSRIALHAPRELLCSRVEMVIVENILCQYRSSSQDVELKLALIQSVAEVSCAIQGVSNVKSFNFSSKRVLLAILLDFMEQEPVGCPASPVPCKAVLALEHLSKIKPSLTREENCHLLRQCSQGLIALPPLEPSREEGEAAKDAQHGQSLYRQSLGALSRLMTTLEEDLTSSWLQETFHVACHYLPLEQARDFLKAVSGSMLSFSPTCANAARKWMMIFLEQRGRELLPEVPEVLTVLYDRLPACQQDALRVSLMPYLCWPPITQRQLN